MKNIYLGHSKDLPRETSSKILPPPHSCSAGATAVRLLGAEESSADSGEDTRPHLRSTGLTGKLSIELCQIKIGCNSGSSKNLHYIFYLKNMEWKLMSFTISKGEHMKHEEQIRKHSWLDFANTAFARASLCLLL